MLACVIMYSLLKRIQACYKLNMNINLIDLLLNSFNKSRLITEELNVLFETFKQKDISEVLLLPLPPIKLIVATKPSKLKFLIFRIKDYILFLNRPKFLIPVFAHI